MTEQELAGAGAVLLAAYLGIDRLTLLKGFKAVFEQSPTLSSAVLWNIVKLLREEGKSTTEAAIITEIDVWTVELVKRCLETMAKLP